MTNLHTVPIAAPASGSAMDHILLAATNALYAVIRNRHVPILRQLQDGQVAAGLNIAEVVGKLWTPGLRMARMYMATGNMPTLPAIADVTPVQTAKKGPIPMKVIPPHRNIPNTTTHSIA